jgi:uncharacterized membrane protein
MPGLGKILVFIGIMLIILGVIIWLGGDKLGWFGRLPGDIKIERENLRFYFPITSMVLISALISLILWLLRRFF